MPFVDILERVSERVPEDAGDHDRRQLDVVEN
jgi:hypothetical protein